MPPAAQSPATSVHLLGNGDYAVMLTGSGCGYSRWKGFAVSRWQAQPYGFEQGMFVYVRDLQRAAVWSATSQPTGGAAQCWFDPGLIRYARRDGDVTTTVEVAVDPVDPMDVRGIAVRNDGPIPRSVELTSYLELVLGPVAADAAHPAFSKMFVETFHDGGVLLARRRKRAASDPDIWAAHALVVDGASTGVHEFETDRARFIGRDGSLARPAALQPGQPLSGTTGSVLDPIFSLRAGLVIEPGETRRVAFVTAVGESRRAVQALVHRYTDVSACMRVFAQARQRSGGRAAMRDMAVYQRLGGALLYDDATLRPPPRARTRGGGGAPILWAAGISGDLPILVARVGCADEALLVQELLHAQDFWCGRQLPADIVVLNTATGGDADAVAAALAPITRDAPQHDKSQGSVFVLRADRIDERLRDGLLACANCVLDGGGGGLAQLTDGATAGARCVQSGSPLRQAMPVRGGRPADVPEAVELAFWNGIGGFTRDGREYVVVLADGASTPMPWSHVVANPDFGFLTTAVGGGYAWAVNSQQNQITRWSNDPVCDPPGDSLLLRDLEDAGTWSATPSPIRAGGATYVARFGPGYVRFDANVHGIESELVQCVAESDPVRLSRLRLHNHSGRSRRIAVAQVVEWMLGPIGRDPRATIRVESDVARGAVFACNPWREEFTDAVAFIACSAKGSAPGSEPGPRSAVVATVELAPDAAAELVFVLGEGRDREEAVRLVDGYRAEDFDATLAAAHKTWAGVLDPLQVETPEPSLNLLVNRCLPYQVVACRLWARTAFYQASGAFGFRDQLQDVGALCGTRPDLARRHILVAASRQFEEGDVQHWWLPPTGRGVRTRIVDDRLWLPLIVAHYVHCTHDLAILDAAAPFLTADALQPDHADAFFLPQPGSGRGSLFEHCARAIDSSFATGVHGLPLIGAGDWNDGLNRVGAGGKGESVWMAWFLCKVIADFAPFAEARRDPRAARWRDHARALQLAAETKAWDGAWYRRAFYDDGTPLGTAADEECRIESMAQSWAVISGAGDPERAARAMQAVNEQLVRSNDGLVALFTAPFDATPRDPGYIKGYPPGLRENGGQYTHGSIWSLIAFAILGDGDKAGELLRIFDPIAKSATPESMARYKVEPYVECADVYSVPPHVGRGGWTWYSGSAGWLYRAIVEWVLGIRIGGDRVQVAPCIPHHWAGYAFTLQRGATRYRIEVENPGHVCGGVARLELDGVRLDDPAAGIAFTDDGGTHLARVILSS